MDRHSAQFVRLLAVAALAFGLSSMQASSAQTGQTQTSTQPPTAPQEKNVLVIQNDSNLPDTRLGAYYFEPLSVSGGVTPLQWSLDKGALPPGINLNQNGVLSGMAIRGGEFQFTIAVTDSGDPRQEARKLFVIHVRSALTLDWKSPAHVNGNRIEGSVAVSNTSPDDVDLTFDVKAVQENGRATEIGYQHFPLKKGMTKDLPFGDTLPHGGYVLYVNAVGEVAPKNLIYRETLQTHGPLQVTVGP